MKYNGQNERKKREYLRYLREAERYGDTAIDKAAAALDDFEDYTKRRDFRKFDVEHAIGFKRHLATRLVPATGRPLSKATQFQILKALHDFFHWLAGQPGFRSRLSYSDADYFNLPRKDETIARTQRHVGGPTVEQVRHVLSVMPAGSAVEKRNRALIALTLMTGARDGALATLRLKHLDIAGRRLFQDAREVKTKASKTIETFLVDVGGDVMGYVVEWVRFLTVDMLWSPDDPLFPKTKVSVKGGQFIADGLSREFWSSAGPIRDIFRDAFTSAGLPYFNPHALRHTLVGVGLKRCDFPEELKAWSQNIGHSSVMTTLMSYGQVARDRQRDIIGSLTSEARPSKASSEAVDMTAELIRLLRATMEKQGA